MPDEKLPTLWTIGAFARLVAQLRAEQKSGGMGYKTPVVQLAASALEKQVDAAVAQIVKNHRI